MLDALQAAARWVSKRARGAAEVLLLEHDPRWWPLERAGSAYRTTACAANDTRPGWCRARRRASSDSLDPPFDSQLAGPACAAAARLAVDGGFVYLEGPQPLADPPPGLREHRSLRAGAVHAQLFVAYTAAAVAEAAADAASKGRAP